eukprot:GDKI01013802.1.p1 GENE.GDKI01013802.1~~GDKI01013802.1.p1  ORF type:complete len:281 (-),score=55.57 GDKI01013802.1:29-871(-)
MSYPNTNYGNQMDIEQGKPNVYGQQNHYNDNGYNHQHGNAIGNRGQSDFNNEALNGQMDLIIRHGFIKKVYGILSAQLLLTFIIAAPICFSTNVQLWLAKNFWLFILALVFNFGTLIALTCFPSVARNYPTNYILLTIFTCAEGLLVGVATAYYSATSVILAVIITLGVVIACTVFAFQTKYDFTGAGGYLFVGSITLLLFGIIAGITAGSVPILQTVYAWLGAFLFSMYLVYDTQLIVGGKHHKFQFGIDDYVFAALNLYMDIIQLFMFILKIIGEERN